MSEAEKRGVGRPRELPDGTRPRSVRLTDAEWKAVQKYVERLRKPRPARKPRREKDR